MLAGFSCTCLFSHKCGLGTCDVPTPCTPHLPCISCKLREALKTYRIDLLVDPMRPRDHLKTRMETFDFDALIFLISEASLASNPCKIEIKTARRRGRPIFTVLQSGSLPTEYRDRLCMNLSELDAAAGAAKLARAIQEHVTIQRLLGLSKSAPPDIRRTAARELYTHDGSVLAEYLSDIETAYRATEDDTACYWLALTLEKTDAPKSIPIAESLLTREQRAYPRLGLQRTLGSLKAHNIGGSNDDIT